MSRTRGRVKGGGEDNVMSWKAFGSEVVLLQPLSEVKQMCSISCESHSAPISFYCVSAAQQILMCHQPLLGGLETTEGRSRMVRTKRGKFSWPHPFLLTVQYCLEWVWSLFKHSSVGLRYSYEPSACRATPALSKKYLSSERYSMDCSCAKLFNSVNTKQNVTAQ